MIEVLEMTANPLPMIDASGVTVAIQLRDVRTRLENKIAVASRAVPRITKLAPV